MVVQPQGNEAKDLWSRAQPVLREILGEAPFRTHIARIGALSATSELVTLACASRRHRDVVVERYGATITDVLAQLSKQVRRVAFVFGPDAKLAAQRPAGVWEGDATLPEPQMVAGSAAIDRKLTFRNFVNGKANQTARDQAEAFADGVDDMRGPFFLSGPTGSGKTHLAAAIVWRLLSRDPGKRALILTAEGFLEKALSPDEWPAFVEAAQSADIIVCDDLQRLAGRTETAAAQSLFALLLDSIERDARLIFTADVPPLRMDFLPKALKVRLTQGVLAETPPANLDLRVAILREAVRRRRSEIEGFNVPENVLHLIAGHLHGDARVLQAALSRIEARLGAAGGEISLKSAANALADFFRAHRRVITIGEIKKAVASYYRMHVEDLEAQNRQREFVKARQICMFLGRQLTSRSYPEIGRAMRRDHTTCMHGDQRVRARIAKDAYLAAEVEAIKKSIRG